MSDTVLIQYPADLGERLGLSDEGLEALLGRLAKRHGDALDLAKEEGRVGDEDDDEPFEYSERLRLQRKTSKGPKNVDVEMGWDDSDERYVITTGAEDEPTDSKVIDRNRTYSGDKESLGVDVIPRK